MPRVGSPLALSIVALLMAVPGIPGDVGSARAQTTAPAADKPAPDAKKKSSAKAKSKAAADGEAAPAKIDPTEAGRLIETAQKSLDAGKHDLALNQANALIGRTGLDARSMARALAVRGQAYRKQGKPAQAISDLQSALWLKGGLNDTERAAAQQARIEAYREAGLPEPQAVGAAKAATTTPPAPASNVQTASTAKAPPRPEAPGAALAPGQPAAAPAAPSSGGFFSSLFGGSSAPPAPRPPAAAAAPAAPAATAPAQPVRAALATPSAAPPAPAVKDAAGRFRLQLGAVRSKQEAQAVAEQVKKAHGTDIGERRYDIEETVFGNMGTFYRVRIGPYADGETSKAMCATLRTKGYDCMVVTQ